MKFSEYPKLILPDTFDNRMRDEAPSRGIISDVDVELCDGKRYRLTFMNPVRIRSDIENTKAYSGKTFLAEQGLVVLDEVSVDAIQEVLQDLFEEGFFNNLRPIE